MKPVIHTTVKITYSNHTRRGELHGTIVEIKDSHIYLQLFTDDHSIIPIQKKYITSIEPLTL